MTDSTEKKYTLREIADQICFKNPPFPMRLKVASGLIWVDMHVGDRNTGLPRDVIFVENEHFVHPYEGREFEKVYSYQEGLAILYRVCKDALLHELDESFHVADKRIFDPHDDVAKELRERIVSLSSARQ